MREKTYTTKELHSSFGHAYFTGVNYLVYRVTTSRGRYEVKASRIPLTETWNVKQNKI